MYICYNVHSNKTVHKKENKDQNSSCPLKVTLCRLRDSEIKKVCGRMKITIMQNIQSNHLIVGNYSSVKLQRISNFLLNSNEYEYIKHILVFCLIFLIQVA